MDIVFLVIIVIICLLIFYFLKKRSRKVNPIVFSSLSQTEISSEIVSSEEILIDENGAKYRNLYKTREVPRKTFIKGDLIGKYWGELDSAKEEEYKNTKFYDFNIYDAEVSNTQYQFTPFAVKGDTSFQRERLPELLPIIVEKDGKEYAVNIHEPQLIDVVFDQKTHQIEGNEVFGTINAEITGYVLDFITENFVERVYIIEPQIATPVPSPVSESALTKTNSATGKIEYNGNYQRAEYYYSDNKTKYWGNWVYKEPQSGCLSGIWSLFIGIISLIVFIALLPNLAFLIPFILIPFILNLLPENFWLWIFRILGGLLLIAFLIFLINLFSHSSGNYIPKPVIVEDKPNESKPSSIDTNQLKNETDTIFHYRSWQGYAGESYEGSFWVKKTDFINSNTYKNGLNIIQNSQNNYDQMIYSLKEFDNPNLDGVYHLFDSIKNTQKLSSKEFAESMVSFVQDIPYAIVLPDECNPNLYSDDFIRNYLSSNKANCDGNQKFGINTPVEFMASLQGDCDTRTLFLYTLLAHYGYDVALLSSEFYSHSIIGINLPYEGTAYVYNGQRYQLWETTAKNFKPGFVPNEISNINYWRISLKSK